MALLDVLQFPDARLRRVSQPIETVTDEIRKLAEDMLETMYDEPGIGLAAPQVGHSIRLIVVDTDWTDEDEDGGEADRKPTVLVNPEITGREGRLTWTEGCLSVPDLTADVQRAERVVLKARDLDGNEVIEEVEGLRAVCFQHEIDHLDGILFIDRLSRLKRDLYVQKRKKALKADEQPWSAAGERPPLQPGR